ncbi:hypothetical protein McaMca56_000467 [Microsporum canis]
MEDLRSEPLPTTFDCLFCNHENCVLVKLNKKLGFGNLSCKICGQRFQTGINYLSAAVDVYSDWVDACDAVAKEGPREGGSSSVARADEGPSASAAPAVADEGLDDDY